MRYLPATPSKAEGMLKTIGVASFEELLQSIPKAVRQEGTLGLEPAYSEHRLIQSFERWATRNRTFDAQFVGSGIYHHFIPTIVDSVISRGEFLTSYTPYQPEVCQGTLQAAYEFQTLVCQLLGSEVANASMYDGATALAEAVLQALRVTRRHTIILPRSLHPNYRSVLKTYSASHVDRILEVPVGESGQMDLGALEQRIDEAGKELGCVVIQTPNFFGCVEPLDKISALLKSKKVFWVTSTMEPFSFGLLKPPGEWGADIVTAEGQAFGNPAILGGRSVGFYGFRNTHIRSAPGRIVGRTVDAENQESFTLTFETREQHIRRDRATSNICTSQMLLALASTVHMLTLGPRGLRVAAHQNWKNMQYAKARLAGKTEVRIRFHAPTFNELCVDCPNGIEPVFNKLTAAGILPGAPIGQDFPELKDCFVSCFTETTTKEQIDRLADQLS